MDLRKRELSPDSSAANQQVSKIPKHRRTNSGSVPREELDKVINLMEKLIPLCNELEGLFVDPNEASSTGDVKPSDKADGLTFGKEAADGEGGDAELEIMMTNPLSFSYLKNVAKDLDNNVKQLKYLQASETSSVKVEIIPFSSVVAADYNKLAIEGNCLSVGMDTLCEAITDIMKKPTSDVATPFTTELDRVRKDNLNPWSEMTARKLIDVYFDFIKNDKVFPANRMKIVTSPEFGILERGRSKEPNQYPIINMKDNLKTYLNGSTDYLTILAAGKTLATYQDHGMQQYRSKSRQKGWLESIIRIAKTSKGTHLSVCEAKWLGAKLDEHIPQVVAEAIGLQRKTGRKYVPFCLSNGLEWVFGALQALGDETSASNWFWVSKNYEVKTDEEAITVLWLLRFWTVSPEEDIWELARPKECLKELNVSNPVASQIQDVQAASSSTKLPFGQDIGYKYPNDPKGKSADRNKKY